MKSIIQENIKNCKIYTNIIDQTKFITNLY